MILIDSTVQSRPPVKQHLTEMKTIILFCFLALATAAFARPEEHYTNKWDNVDVEEILQNKRLFEPYIKCTLDQGKCAPDAKELKSHIKEALETKCAKCTESQKEGTRKVIKHLINEEPKYWKDLSAKYDPENKHTTAYEEELKKLKE